jgi:hypothetical protein
MVIADACSTNAATVHAEYGYAGSPEGQTLVKLPEM